jgi:MoaA/NifB/PqqE/SkfB family radical SAM enzyme
MDANKKIKIKNIKGMYNLITRLFKKINKDFSNTDLTKYDLSNIDPKEWKNAKFTNANLSGTGIRINPAICHWNFENCDFSNNDLSYLTEENLYNINIKGCNFTNTNLDVDFRYSTRKGYRRVIFDKNYDAYPDSFWDNLDFDLETLKLNPNIKISSFKLISLIKNYLNLEEQTSMSNSDWEQRVLELEEILKYDNNGHLIYLYNLIKDLLDVEGKYDFFKGYVVDTKLKDLDFGNIPLDLWGEIKFKRCNFENITLGNDIKSLFSDNTSTFDDSSEYKNIYFSSLTKGSWQDLKYNRFSESPMTVRTFLYLELDRICNASCTFCRNNTFDKQKYSLENINNNLKEIYGKLDDIIIGGGEPTLRLKDLYKLKEQLDSHGHYNSNWHVFTNATLHYPQLKRLNKLFNLNISRHAVDDQENADIFGCNVKNILSSEHLRHLIYDRKKSIVLCATCFKGGLDSAAKIIEYIEWARELKAKDVLLSSLHKDFSVGNNEVNYNSIDIDDNLFNDVINYYLLSGYIEKEFPIISTGGYVTRIIKNNNPNLAFRNQVAFKSYISKEKFDKMWPGAIKRTFDLSMNPAGEVFENWHQTSGKVYIKK